MPVVLRIICAALSVLIILHASLAPLVEDGLTFVFPIVIDAVLLSLLWSFSRRQPEMLAFLSKASPFLAVLGLAFGLDVTGEYGRWSWVVRIRAVLESGAWVALFFALRAPAVRTWFYRSESSPVGGGA